MFRKMHIPFAATSDPPPLKRCGSWHTLKRRGSWHSFGYGEGTVMRIMERDQGVFLICPQKQKVHEADLLRC